MITMQVIGAKVIAGLWDAAAATIEPRSNQTTRVHGLMLESKIKGRASGRPGPRTITGDYRRSWSTEQWAGGWVVGTNKAQGPRLENGFSGADSLGRVYNQPPFPHVKPSVDEIEPLYEAAMAKTAVEGL